MFEYVASGNAVFGSAADVISPYYQFTGDGEVETGASAFAGVQFETSLQSSTWDVSQGILRYYRVESKVKPFLCPPVCAGNPYAGYAASDPIKFVLNISAHNVSEVCRKLKAMNFIGPIQKIQVFSIPVLKDDLDPTSDPTANQLTDVNLQLADCLDLLVDVNVKVSVVVSSSVIVVADHTQTGSGGATFGGSATVTLNNWTYVAGGNGVFGGQAGATSPQNPIYLGSGGATFGGEASYFNSFVGTFSASALVSVDVSDQEIEFGFSEALLMVPLEQDIDSVCCGDLPTLLYMNHEFSRMTKFAQFLNINDFDIGRNLRMVYKSSRNAWYFNQHYQGTSTTNEQESWDITTEFGCMDHIGLPITGEVWGFSMSFRNRNLQTSTNSYTRLLVAFNPEEACTFDASINFSFNIDTRRKLAFPSNVQAVVLLDEIGLFKGGSFINNPNMTFRVGSASTGSVQGLIDNTKALEELLV